MARRRIRVDKIKEVIRYGVTTEPLMSTSSRRARTAAISPPASVKTRLLIGCLSWWLTRDTVWYSASLWRFLAPALW